MLIEDILKQHNEQLVEWRRTLRRREMDVDDLDHVTYYELEPETPSTVSNILKQLKGK